MTRIPTFGYPGGKARLAKRIVAMLPASGKRYVEPFVGRGNVYFAVAQLLKYEEFWVNDLARLFLNSIEQFGHFYHIAAVPRTKGEYEKLKAWVQEEEGLVAAGTMARLGDTNLAAPYTIYCSTAHLLEPLLCYSGGIFGGGSRGWGHGFSHKNVSAENYEKSIRLAHEIIKRTKPRITNLDYREVLRECGKDDVVYLDPPYFGADVDAYSDTTLDHEEMVLYLQCAEYKWVLSEYWQPLYLDQLGEPSQIIPVRNGMGNRGKRLECLWTNIKTKRN